MIIENINYACVMREIVALEQGLEKLLIAPLRGTKRRGVACRGHDCNRAKDIFSELRLLTV